VIILDYKVASGQKLPKWDISFAATFGKCAVSIDPADRVYYPTISYCF